MVRYTISAISKNGLPYRIATVSDLATEPKEFHRMIQERIVQRHGWGTYCIARAAYFGERRGYKLVVVFRITAEGVTVLKADPSRPVFPDFPSKHMWWEKETLIPRNIGIAKPRRYVRTGLKSMLLAAGVVQQTPRLKTRHQHGKVRIIDALMKGLR